MTLGGGTESTLVLDVAFWIVALSTIVAAIAVVQNKDVFSAALCLVVAFIGTAATFVLLRAEFLAIVQVIIYVGAIAVLMLFAILMTRDVGEGSPSNRLRVPALVLAVLFFATTAFAVLKTDWNELNDVLPQDGVTSGATLSSETVGVINDIYANTVPHIAGLLLRDYVLAFEAASVLLLAAVVGALALVREREPMRLENFLLLGAILFAIGLYGALTKRNTVTVLMALELMFNAVNITAVALSRYVVPATLANNPAAVSEDAVRMLLTGQIFTIFIITVAAAEVALGVAIVITLYRNRETVFMTDANQMRH